MALLWIEGFEGYGTATNSAPQPVGVIGRKYPYTAFEQNMDLEVGRLGGYCLELPGASAMGTPSLTTDDTLIVGFAFRVDGSSNLTLMALWDGASKNVNLRYNKTSLELEIYLDNVLLETTSGLGIANHTWYWIEMAVKTNGSVGTYDVELSGVNILSDTGIDTQTGSNAWSSSIRWFGGGTTNRWDDMYVCDSTGSTNNGMLGNVKVIGLSPNADDTANFGTSTPNVSHYANVDENPSDDDTSYVEDSTANVTDLYDYETLSGSGDIFGLQINTQCRETDAATFSLITPIKSNGTQSDDAGTVVGTTSYTTRSRVSEIDPDTSAAWTFAGVDAAKFGIKVG
jgi:hypothetical protein